MPANTAVCLTTRGRCGAENNVRRLVSLAALAFCTPRSCQENRNQSTGGNAHRGTRQAASETRKSSSSCGPQGNRNHGECDTLRRRLRLRPRGGVARASREPRVTRVYSAGVFAEQPAAALNNAAGPQTRRGGRCARLQRGLHREGTPSPPAVQFTWAKKSCSRCPMETPRRQVVKTEIVSCGGVPINSRIFLEKMQKRENSRGRLAPFAQGSHKQRLECHRCEQSCTGQG